MDKLVHLAPSAKDEGVLQAFEDLSMDSLIAQALISQSAKGYVLSLRDAPAVHCMDSILAKLDGLNANSPTVERTRRFTLRRLLIQLSKASNHVPSSLYIVGVDCKERNAIAGGAYADIFRGTLHSASVALKRLRVFKTDPDPGESHSNLLREALVWQQLHHPFILPFLGIDHSTFSPYYSIISPWMNNGNIIQYMNGKVLISPSSDPLPLTRWFREIAEGLGYLHSEHIVHADLRGANILIDAEQHIRLGDFGLARFADTSSASIGSHHGGAARWLAPEVLNGSRASYTSDIYAYGCVWLEIYTLRPPMHELSDIQVLAQKLRNIGPQWPSPTDDPRMGLNLADWAIIRDCWHHEPSLRPDAQMILAQTLMLDIDTLAEQFKEQPWPLWIHSFTESLLSELLTPMGPSSLAHRTLCKCLDSNFTEFVKVFIAYNLSHPNCDGTMLYHFDTSLKELAEKSLYALLQDFVVGSSFPSSIRSESLVLQWAQRAVDHSDALDGTLLDMFWESFDGSPPSASAIISFMLRILRNNLDETLWRDISFYATKLLKRWLSPDNGGGYQDDSFPGMQASIHIKDTIIILLARSPYEL
ncbi:unnamed protein product [Somion occarium]|uniref:Protein kinase domain-containing protein n=1 Tax=Somion occarium TaxID=3059160 RepID=A0ABP1DF62_9APHY